MNLDGIMNDCIDCRWLKLETAAKRLNWNPTDLKPRAEIQSAVFNKVHVKHSRISVIPRRKNPTQDARGGRRPFSTRMKQQPS